MNKGTGKCIDWGRNGKRICALLILLLLSGLFGCGKKEAYTVSLEKAGREESYEALEAEALERDFSEDEGALREAGEKGDKSEPEKDRIYVHICGAVNLPGVYEFTGETRVFQVVERAGGLLPKACGEALNQAGTVEDGSRIYVPTVEEWESGYEALAADKGAEETGDGLVNINTADEEKLCSLPGVGKTRAQAILEYRTEHGGFQAIEDIQKVSGIKSGLFEKIKDYIKVK